MKYNPRDIEKKWQSQWKNDNTYQVKIDENKPKYYVLDMFPYPSGAGLHVGHPLGYIASDIISRYKRSCGFNVLHPMGFDAFGLPAEQYAIEHGIHPAISTDNNINRYKEQLENIGFSYDWSREVRTCDPQYYKWTQWIFLNLFHHYYDLEFNSAKPIDDLKVRFETEGSLGIKAFHSEHEPFTYVEWGEMSAAEKDQILMNYRLAYRRQTLVNWCEALGTVLANDEVKDGVSERGGFPVERKPMLQWSLRITAYADRLLTDMEKLEWSSALKIMQKNWIGRSEGAQVFFPVADSDAQIEVYTTRPDTLFGATFMVLAPEHPLVAELTSKDQDEEISKYVSYAKRRSERERQSEAKNVTGAFTGSFAVNPVNDKKIPIWIADYVLMDYGTGAIMAVPDGDLRDEAFANKFDLEIIKVIDQSEHPEAGPEDKVGKMVNSGFINDLNVKDAIKKMINYLEENELGSMRVNFKLRDANYSRQRYWGEPFPIRYNKEGQTLADSLDSLPLELPDLDDFKPATGAKSPLSRLDAWIQLEDGTERETDTMPGFAGSSWYFLRYMDPKNTEAFASSKALNYWRDVDLYIGGTEHAVGHLLYSRFWHKFLYDIGHVPTAEPFKKLVNQGMIQGRSSFVYRLNDQAAEHFVKDKLKEYGFKLHEDFPVGGIYVDLAIPDKKLAIEIKSAEKLKHFIENRKNAFDREGWKIVGIPTQKIGKFWNNFDVIVKMIDRAQNGGDQEPIDPNMESNPIYLSKDMVKDEQMVTTLHVNINFVKDDKLDMEAFSDAVPHAKNALFITNKAGEYICGHTVEKMSKRYGNVVNPDDVVDQYGTDCFRMYEMFLGPVEQSKPWDTKGIDGVSKFLRKFWGLFFSSEDDSFSITDKEPSKAELKILHQTIKKVSEDIERLSFNTAISALMVAANELKKLGCNKRTILEPLVLAISPLAPHIAEELWHRLGHEKTVCDAAFPSFDESYIKESEIEYPVSINGKKRASAFFSADSTKDDLEKLALEVEGIQKWIAGKTVRKIIVVPGRMINIVVS